MSPAFLRAAEEYGANFLNFESILERGRDVIRKILNANVMDLIEQYPHHLYLMQSSEDMHRDSYFYAGETHELWQRMGSHIESMLAGISNSTLSAEHCRNNKEFFIHSITMPGVRKIVRAFEDAIMLGVEILSGLEHLCNEQVYRSYLEMDEIKNETDDLPEFVDVEK